MKMLSRYDWEEVEECLEVELIDRSRSSPANLSIRLLQPDSDVWPIGASGIYLSNLNEYTDWTQFIELAQLTQVFSAQIDKRLCMDSVAVQK